MQDCMNVGFIGCMRQNYMRNIRWMALIVVLVILSACMVDKAESGLPSGDRYDYFDPGTQNDLAIGTVRSQDGVRFIRLDEKSCSQVMNPKEIADIADGTRVFLQYRYVVAANLADFCTEAILVEWVSPIEQGGTPMLNFEESFSADAIKSATYSDPMDIVTDWMTCLEDGFLTLHYLIPTSGEKKHHFSLYQSLYDYNQYYLIHNADGDTKGSVTDGIVCFEVSSKLPKTEGKTVKLSFVYIDLNHTEKRLTFDYCSPK